jgi:O-antigen ligase
MGAGLWLFFLSILCIDLLFHMETFGKDFGNYIYFALAPFVFLGVPKSMLRQLMRVFQFAILLFVIVLVVSITERYFKFISTESYEWVFFNITNGYWHTSYLAGFIIVAHVFALKNDKNLTLSMFLIPIALYFNYITESRLPNVSFMVIRGSILVLRIKKRKWRNLIIGISAILLFSFSAYLITHNEHRDQLLAKYFPAKTDMMDARPALWATGYELIQQNTFTGIGRMNIRSALAEALPQETKLKHRNYNLHNQYLEWWLGYGAIALLMFIVILVFPLKYGLPNYVWFFGYIVIVLCVESYFARQAGVIFFSLWYCYFLMYDRTSSRIHKTRD